jgi:hypothetical protein
MAGFRRSELLTTTKVEKNIAAAANRSCSGRVWDRSKGPLRFYTGEHLIAATSRAAGSSSAVSGTTSCRCFDRRTSVSRGNCAIETLARTSRRLDNWTTQVHVRGSFLSKVMQRLVHAGFVASHRGNGGGFCLHGKWMHPENPRKERFLIPFGMTNLRISPPCKSDTLPKNSSAHRRVIGGRSGLFPARLDLLREWHRTARLTTLPCGWRLHSWRKEEHRARSGERERR